MEDKKWNLLKEPWIRVVTQDGIQTEISLSEALLNARKYKCLCGELAAQNVAVLRLLLAIVQTVVYRYNENGEEELLEEPDDALHRWKVIWDQRELPQTELKNYFSEWEDRFWLIHPERPFYQVLSAKIGTEYTAAKLNGAISQSDHKVKMFAGKDNTSRHELTFSEASRWLLYLNGFDDNSSKPKGKAEEKGTGAPGVGLLGKLGLIYIRGDTLFETIMLNLVLINTKEHECWKEPKPIWELEVPRERERVLITIPDNQAELLSLQSRRILLKEENDRIVGYSVMGGDFFSKEHMLEEQMSLWHVIKERNKAPYIGPKEHEIGKQMWRNFSNIIVPDTSNIPAPGIVQWINLLKRKKLINYKKYICIKSAFVTYGGGGNYFVVDTYGDELNVSSDLFSEKGNVAAALIENEIIHCDNASNIINQFAKNLLKASGNRALKNEIKASERFYSEIDIAFRNWIVKISLDENGQISELETLQKDWREKAYQISISLGKELVNEAGDAAFNGRYVEEDGKRYFISSSKAYNSFLNNIRECFQIKYKGGKYDSVRND